jgi:hypothetical protein
MKIKRVMVQLRDYRRPLIRELLKTGKGPEITTGPLVSFQIIY